MATRLATNLQWKEHNPTPADGDICISTDTGRRKIGDGSTAWRELDFEDVVDRISKWGAKSTIATTYLTDFSVNLSGNVVATGGHRVVDYIPVDPNNKYYHSGRFFYDPSVLMLSFKDADGAFISGYKPAANTTYTSQLVVMPANAAYMAFTNGNLTTPILEVAGVERTTVKEVAEIANDLIIGAIIKTFKRTGVSGVDADFCGLTAITDALASITDASANKRYILSGTGIFHFTDTASLPYTSLFGEKSAIYGKDYVDIIGSGNRDELIIAVELADNLAINYGKYQPVFWACNARLENATIIAKNCRYALHLEGGTAVYNTEFNIENVLFWHKGNFNLAATGGSGATAWVGTNAVGAGIEDGQTFNFKSCTFRSLQYADFKCHSPLHTCNSPSKINLISCIFDGDVEPFAYDIYPTLYKTLINIVDPVYKRLERIRVTSYVSTRSTVSDAFDAEITQNTLPILYNATAVGKGLRIISKSTGVASIVTVNTACTAFASIIGDLTKTVAETSDFLATKQYGYYWKDGLVGSKGYLIGGVDIDSSTSHTSLGKKLGNCSVTNKTLTLSVDGTTYNVVFNTNLTAASNAAVIALITTVIGAVADVDEFAVGLEYYPNFNGVKVLTNADSIAIIAGMGLVYLSATTCRAALNSDNYIDAIAIDSSGVTGKLRAISGKGAIIKALNSGERFSTLEATNASRALGVGLGVSESSPGYFDVSATPKVLRAVGTNILKLI